jgi:hypothetical protein
LHPSGIARVALERTDDGQLHRAHGERGQGVDEDVQSLPRHHIPDKEWG